MATLQLKRGTTAQNNSYVGPSGEITMDTTTKQVRIHDGVTTGGISVGTMIITSVKTSAYSANVGELVRINSTAGGFTVMLPASPVDGSKIQIVDVANQCGTNPVLIAANGKTILSDATGINIDVNGAELSLLFNSSTNDWVKVSSFGKA